MRGNESVYPADFCEIGGGINDCRIVHDATGCGHFVTLSETSDPAPVAPSFSSKQLNGGLRLDETQITDLDDWMNTHRAGEYGS